MADVQLQQQPAERPVQAIDPQYHRPRVWTTKPKEPSILSSYEADIMLTEEEKAAQALAAERHKLQEADKFQRQERQMGWPRIQFYLNQRWRTAQSGVLSRNVFSHSTWVTVSLNPKAVLATVHKALAKLHTITDEVMDELDCPLNALVGIDTGEWVKWMQHRRKQQTLQGNQHNSVQEEKSAATPYTLPPGLGGDYNYTDITARDGHVVFPHSPITFLVCVKGDRADACFETVRRFLRALDARTNARDVEVTMGFRYLKGQDLTGFIDGSRNGDVTLNGPVSTALVDAPDQCYNGGSFMFAARFVHDLDKFERLDAYGKNDIMGRDITQQLKCPYAYGSDGRVENPMLEMEPPHSHLAMSAENRMYRQAFPYVHPHEQGLFFSAFARDPRRIESTLHTMACSKQSAYDAPDKLLSVSRAATANMYYCPALAELQSLLP